MRFFRDRARAQAIELARGHAVYVAPATGGDWVVRLSGRFTVQADAIFVARAIATLLELESEVRGEDGQIRAKDSHGHDDPHTPG